MESCRAIVVHRSRWSESSLLVTWLTDRFGTLRTSARGALRTASPFRGKVDLFHQAEISFTPSRSSTLHSLREVSLIRAFESPRGGYQAVALASYFAELGAAVAAPMQPSPELHDLLTRALDHLAAREPGRRAFDHFEKETARILGIFDPTGRQPVVSALTQLCGRLPASRKSALDALTLPAGSPPGITPSPPR